MYIQPYTPNSPLNTPICTPYTPSNALKQPIKIKKVRLMDSVSMDVTQKIAAQAQFAKRRILREQGRAFRGLNTMTRRLQVGANYTYILINSLINSF